MMPSDSTDKLKYLALTVSASVSVLGAWVYTYEYTCFALVVPIFIAVVIAKGSYASIVHRRNYRLSYYFKDTSPIFTRLNGRVVATLWSSTIGIVYSISITSLIALGSTSEYITCLIILAVVVSSLARVNAFIDRHVATGIAPFAEKKLMSISGIVIGMTAYIVLTLFSPMPEYLVHAELGHAVSSASQAVSSKCPITNFILKGAQELSAVQWFYLRSVSDSVNSFWMRLIGWSLFLTYSSLVVFGISRFFTEIAYYFFRSTKE